MVIDIQVEIAVRFFVKKYKNICRRLRRLDKPSFDMSFDIGLQILLFQQAKALNKPVK